MPATWNANVGYAPSEVTTDAGLDVQARDDPEQRVDALADHHVGRRHAVPCSDRVLEVVVLRIAVHPASAAAACIAAMAEGAAPNALSLAPSRARNGRPRRRSSVSGPTNGTLAGRPSTIVVSGAVIAEACQQPLTPRGASRRAAGLPVLHHRVRSATDRLDQQEQLRRAASPALIGRRDHHFADGEAADAVDEHDELGAAQPVSAFENAPASPPAPALGCAE